MENLALCSHALYNKDLLDKKNIIEKLKKESRYYTPIVMVDSQEEWDKKIKDAKDKIAELLTPEKLKVLGWMGHGSGRDDFVNGMTDILFSLSNDKQWSSYHAGKLYEQVDSYLHMYYPGQPWCMRLWNDDDWVEEESAKQIKVITHQFEEYTIRKGDGSGDFIAHYTCSQCNKLESYPIPDGCPEGNQICWDCYDNKD